MQIRPTIQIHLDSFVLAVLADPVTKQSITPDVFVNVKGVIDARVFLKNTHGYSEWAEGQREYEVWEASGEGYKDDVASFLDEIAHDKPVYDHFKLSGQILDVGGELGTVREFLSPDNEFVSIDPYINAPHEIYFPKFQAYKCLARPLNFIAATAEFLPFLGSSFDWVHMRSMLDHVQVPDLALLEARRVLKPNGRVLVGLYVEGGKTGLIALRQKAKDAIKHGLERIGVDRWKDHHIWHPTYSGLIKLMQDNGFAVEDVFWQPYWKDQVCYVCARKSV